MTTTDDPVFHPDRYQPFENINNFRDLGGYPTQSGRPTRFGSVYRSATLHNASQADRRRLAELGVVQTIDLRSLPELERDGLYAFDEVGITRQHVPVSADVDMSPEQMLARYRLYSIDVTQAYASILQRGREAYRRVFEILAEDERPVVYHCSGGKDRAGVLSALILSVSGVERELVIADYALTTRYLPEPPPERVAQFLALYGLSRAEFSAMHASAPDSMRRTLAMIDAEHGSPEGYLRAIGVEAATLERVRSRLVA